MSAGAAASLRVLDATNAAEAVTGEKLDASTRNFLPLKEKIALEEHFAFPEILDTSYAAVRSAEFQSQIAEISTSRIAEMDRGGVQLSILSLVAPGIQAIPNTAQAISVARRANDYLAEHIAKYPKRLKGFAAVPLQDPDAAAQKLTRCAKNWGFAARRSMDSRRSARQIPPCTMICHSTGLFGQRLNSSMYRSIFIREHRYPRANRFMKGIHGS